MKIEDKVNSALNSAIDYLNCAIEEKELLDIIELKIKESKNQVVLFTTNRSHYKDKLSTTQGFGIDDLKDTFYNVYGTLLARYGRKFTTKLINPNNYQVDFIFTH